MKTNRLYSFYYIRLASSSKVNKESQSIYIYIHKIKDSRFICFSVARTINRNSGFTQVDMVYVLVHPDAVSVEFEGQYFEIMSFVSSRHRIVRDFD